jgi:hypothetical protein
MRVPSGETASELGSSLLTPAALSKSRTQALCPSGVYLMVTASIVVLPLAFVAQIVPTR